MMANNFPVIDLHCDLLSYLASAAGRSPFNKNDIGCNFTALKYGNVKLQVMAIYSSTENGSADFGLKQSLIFKDLLAKHQNEVELISDVAGIQKIDSLNKTGVVVSIENASCFCEEGDKLTNGFNNLEKIIENTSRVLYIGFTHHGENRFGGGNTTKVGLKPDGKALLEYMSGKKIALDFSHTSDALAYDMLDYLYKQNLDIPILASHSNFREVFSHPRNLPDDIAKEIVARKGIVGMNFLRAFMNNTRPEVLMEHILHGLSLNANICFGADYFYTANHPDQSRRPFYFSEHEDASCYPAILAQLSKLISQDDLDKISHRNAADFIKKLWE